MKERSLSNAIFVTMHVTENIPLKNILLQFMKERSLSNAIFATMHVPANTALKDIFVSFMKERRSLISANSVNTAFLEKFP